MEETSFLCKEKHFKNKITDAFRKGISQFCKHLYRKLPEEGVKPSSYHLFDKQELLVQ